MRNDRKALADGGHGFDFLHGAWLVANHKLRDPLDPECDEWVDFEAAVETQPLPKLGNIDRFHADDVPGRGALDAIALRLYDPAQDLWSIWWASTAGPGKLDAPVTGRFVDGVGRFEGDDVVDGQRTRVRFEWLSDEGTNPRWRQFFSFDDGENWYFNWQMDLRRRPSAGL